MNILRFYPPGFQGFLLANAAASGLGRPDRPIRRPCRSCSKCARWNPAGARGADISRLR